MADKFFTNPNNKKRKRTTSVVPKSKSRAANINNKSTTQKGKNTELTDEEIPSDSDDMAEEINSESDAESLDGTDSDEDEKETAADKRRRLAKQYLENIHEEMAEVEGFDAADLDRELISNRLQQDIAEEQGSVYKFVSNTFPSSLDSIHPQFNHLKSYGVNSVAIYYPYAYTVTKDLYLAKWDITNCSKSNQRPKLLKYVRGNHRVGKTDESYNGHVDEILCVAASPDGKHIATAGKDKRIMVWTAENLAPVKAIPIKVGNKSVTVTGLTFRRGAHNGADLYASCSDLIVRIFNIHHLAQTETLFGHQDAVADISALGQERCLTVGSRDRTALVWKINDETRLTFRGGDSEKIIKKVREAKERRIEENENDETSEMENIMLEGSIDTCAMIDDSHFLTGSDNGNISLWSVTRRRPLAVVREAHGKDNALTPQQASAETAKDAKIEIPPRIPRAITALTAVPYTDIFFSGSWDGTVKIWKLTQDLKSFELAGEVKVPGYDGSLSNSSTLNDGEAKPEASKQSSQPSSSTKQNTQKHKPKKNKKYNSNLPGLGVINKISVAEYGPKGRENYTVVAAVSKELRNGRWIKIKNGKNGILTFNLPRKQ